MIHSASSQSRMAVVFTRFLKVFCRTNRQIVENSDHYRPLGSMFHAIIIQGREILYLTQTNI